MDSISVATFFLILISLISFLSLSLSFKTFHIVFFILCHFSQGEIKFRFAIESKVVTCTGYSYTIKCKDNNKKSGQTASGAESR